MLCAHCSTALDVTASICTECEESPLLEGRYRLDEIVGRGVAGATYRATDVESGMEVAVKELVFHRLDSFKTQELFEREARVLRQLDHAGIPQYVENFTTSFGRNVSLYLVQEFVDGGDLEREAASRRYHERDILVIVEEIAAVLAYLHDLTPPVVHRDIKPANIMRRRDNDCLVLIDFGAVRDVIAPPEGGHTVAGTFGYMAPEQLRGQSTGKSDVYGLGMTAIALATGHRPEQLPEGPALSTWPRLANLSAGTVELLQSMISQDPRRRPDAETVRRRARGLIAAPQGPVSQVPALSPGPGVVVNSAQAGQNQTPNPTIIIALAAGGAVLVASLAAVFAISAGPIGNDSSVTSAPVRIGPISLGMSPEQVDIFSSLSSQQLCPPDSSESCLTINTVLADFPARCVVEFSPSNGLQHLECSMETDGPDRLRAAQQRLVRESQTAFGTGRLSNITHLGNGTAEVDTWTWRHREANLTIEYRTISRHGAVTAEMTVVMHFR